MSNELGSRDQRGAPCFQFQTDLITQSGNLLDLHMTVGIIRLSDSVIILVDPMSGNINAVSLCGKIR
jgi:hypothetical protein